MHIPDFREHRAQHKPECTPAARRIHQRTDRPRPSISRPHSIPHLHPPGTTRASGCVEGLGRHYERAEVDARRLSSGTTYQVKTSNVSRLVLRETDKAAEVQIDGQTLRVKPGREIAFEKSGGSWSIASARWTGLHKTHALQGPIDDAFLDPFLLVRPTGTPWNEAAHQLSVKRLERSDQTYAHFYRAHPRVKNDTDPDRVRFCEVQCRAVRRSGEQLLDRPACRAAFPEVATP